MPAATAVTPVDRPGGAYQQFTFLLTPAAILTLASEVETVAVPGAALGDAVFITVPAAGYVAGIVAVNARVSVAGTVTFNLMNFTGGSITPAAGTCTLTLVRGTSMVFAR